MTKFDYNKASQIAWAKVYAAQTDNAPAAVVEALKQVAFKFPRK